MVPPNIKAAIDNWVLKGEAPGGFTTAVIKNDLFGAMRHGDPESIANLKDITNYIIESIPADCWGDRDKVAKWAAFGGQKGIHEARQRSTLLTLE
jgi:hypothetical protein